MNFSTMTEQELWAEFRIIFNDLINDVDGMAALSEQYVPGRYLITEGLRLMTLAHNRRVSEKKTEDIEPQLEIRETCADEEVQFCNYLNANGRYNELANALVKIAREDYGTADNMIVRGAAEMQVIYSDRARNGMLKLKPIEEKKKEQETEEVPEIQDVDEEVVESAVLVDADAETVETDNDAETVEEAAEVEKKDLFSQIRLTARNWKDIDGDDSDDNSEKSLDDLLKN